MESYFKRRQSERGGDASTALTLRPIAVRVGEIRECAGSALWSQGLTSTSVSVYLLPPQSIQAFVVEEYNRSTVLVDITCPSSGGSSAAGINAQRRKEKVLSALILRIVEASVDLRMYPNQSILIKGTVLTDGGSVSACLVNCSSLALLNSGVHMFTTPLAICVSIFSGKDLFIDPTSEEEQESESNGVLVLGFSDENRSDVSGDQSNVIFSNFEGVCSFSLMSNAFDLGVLASSVLLECMRGAISASNPIS